MKLWNFQSKIQNVLTFKIQKSCFHKTCSQAFAEELLEQQV